MLLTAPTDRAGSERGTLTDRVARRMGVRPSSGEDEPYLDGLRACAVLAVVVLHVHANAGRPPIEVLGLDLTFLPVTGTYGVLLFFVLSGFLLARPWFRAELTGTPTPKLGTFWFRRFLRIAPAYYLSILVLLLVFVPTPIPPGSLQGRLGVVNLVTHLTFLQQYLPVTSMNFSGIGGVYWTLSMELTFYLVLPFVIPLFTGRRWRITVPVSAALTAVWLYLAQERLQPLVDWMVGSVSPADAAATGVVPDVEHMRLLLTMQFPAYAFTFALGIGLARLVVLREVRRQVHRDVGPAGPCAWWERPRVGLALLVVGATLVLYTQHEVGDSILHPAPGSIWRNIELNLGASLGMALVVYGFAFGPNRARRPLGWLPMRYVGWTSYGIYLYHVPVIAFLYAHTSVASLSTGWQFVFLLGVVLGIATAVATVSWLVVERPLLVWRPSRASRRLLAAAATAVACVVVAVAVGFRAPAATAAVSIEPPTSVAPLLAGPFGDGAIQPASTGAVTLGEAMTRGVLYPIQQTLLGACGRPAVGGVPQSEPVGTSLVLVAPEWTVLASGFACRDDEAARTVVDQLTAWQRAAGFVEVPAAGRAPWPPGGDRGLAFFSDANPATPGYPAQLHVFYVSGDRVVGLLVQARSPAAGEQATADLLRATDQNYPIGR